MNTNSNADTEKHVLWPGATPYFDASIAPKSLRASGVAPGHSVFAFAGELQAIPRPPFVPIPVRADRRCSHAQPRYNQGEPVPLLTPPEAAITQRRYYLRIEESLAQTMERYAEFLGTASIDHVVTQALQFIFKRDSQFKSWLAQNPEPTPKPVKPKVSSNSAASDGGAQ